MNLILKIDRPCEEPLDQMKTIPDGKFCNSCSKKVLDLSKLNESDIRKIIQENEGQKICGILFDNQLNKPIEGKVAYHQIPVKRRASFTKITAGLALTASFIHSYPAQTIKNNTPGISITETPLTKKKAKEKVGADGGNKVIRGKVILKNTGKPVSDVSIKLITFQKIYQTATDREGSYTLEVPDEAIREENLLEFLPAGGELSTELVILKRNEIFNKNITAISENEEYRQYGEISEALPYIHSLVVLDGKRIDYKIFNKSYLLFHNRYEVFYIPKPYSKVFTNDEKIQDIFIAFIR